MAISIREVLQDATSDSTAASVTTGAGTEATDVLVAVGYSSFYTLASGSGFGPPSGGGWTEVTDGTADLGANNSKIRAWTRTADGGAQQVDLPPIVDEDVGLVVLVLAGADTASPVDAAGNATSTGTGSPAPHIAPSVSPVTADALLVCAAASAVFDGGAAYTPPGGMVERADFPVPSNAISCTAATEQLSASGATGTRTFLYDGLDDLGLAISVAIRTASTGVQVGLSAAGEADGAKPVTARKAADLATVAESDTAQPLAASKTAAPAGAGEQDAARPLAVSKTAHLGRASTADRALPVAALKRVPLGAAAELGAARPVLIPAGPLLLGVASTSDTARPVTAVLIRRLGPARTAAAARPVAGRKLAALGVARERDRALALTAAGVTVLRPDTGTVTRPDTGITVRPDTGQVLRP